MQRGYFGEFQELVLLTILVLNNDAYGVSIQKEMAERLNKNVSRGSLHTALSRLEKKGFISSKLGEATPERGGKRKKFYFLTQEGKAALAEARSLRESLWKAIPSIS
ncbi:MAG: helix-turn-helix transcriptional regulator [Bacteroidota bacterium]